MQLSILNTCIVPLLPLLPIAMIWGWLRTLPPGMTNHRILLALGLLTVVMLAVLRVSYGTFQPSSGEIGFVQALWVVVTHPTWFLLGLLGFVHLMVLPIVDEERRRASRIITGVALAAFGVTMFWFIAADADTAVHASAGFLRFTPLNLSVGVAFAFAIRFLLDARIRDRQISVVTLLMIALFIGGVGAMVFSDL